MNDLFPNALERALYIVDEFDGEKVMGVDMRYALGLANGFTCEFDAYIGCFENVYFSHRELFELMMEPHQRYIVEHDPMVKQLMTYIIVENVHSGMILVNQNVAAVEGITGSFSVGIGNHLRKGERIVGSAYRIAEEFYGIHPQGIRSCEFEGHLSCRGNAFYASHIGLVYRLRTTKEEIPTINPEAFIPVWTSPGIITAFYHFGKLDFWSRLLVNPVVRLPYEDAVG